MKVEEFDIGNTVLCDFCDEDYTFSDAIGGFLFQSKGTCPDCAPRLEESAKRYGEEKFIRARAAPGETFRDFVLRVRGGNNKVRISNFETAAEMIKMMRGDS